MAGIKSFGAYIPKYRLGKETAGWGSPTERAACNFDEDSVTMAVAAGMDCLTGQDRSQVDGLFFATTSSPYAEKQGASIIAEALDLRHDILTSDVTGVLRAGTTALRLALDAVTAGKARQVLVVACDSRPALPRSDLERSFGDGAAALLISKGRLPVEIEADFSFSESMLDVWRSEGESFTRSAEDRFILEEGYQKIMPQAVSQFFQKHNLKPQDFARAVYYAPDGRRHQDMGKQLGFAPEQVQEPLFGKLGNTGAAFALMLLVAAMEEAKPQDRILLASYGDGADVSSLRVNPGIRRLGDRRGIRKHLESKVVIPSYETFARWRGVWTSEGARRPAPHPPSPTALWREKEKNIRLYGSKCNACGYLQYPPQRVCTKCQSKDSFTSVRLSDQRGKVFTYSLDYLAGTVDVPLVVAVVNLDMGGRILSMMTDREISQVKIDLPVEMTFRKLRVVGGIHNYYWKSMPVRA